MSVGLYFVMRISIVRVHDVAEMVNVVKTANAIVNFSLV